MIQGLETTWFGEILLTMALSAAPVVELRGGIPYGAYLGLPVWGAFLAAVAGNMLPIPVILIFLDKVFAWMRGYKKLGVVVQRLEARAHLHGRKVVKYRQLGLFILVAIPLPGTGAWTGALVASVLGMPPREAILPIFLGVLGAGVLVSLATMGVIQLI